MHTDFSVTMREVKSRKPEVSSTSGNFPAPHLAHFCCYSPNSKFDVEGFPEDVSFTYSRISCEHNPVVCSSLSSYSDTVTEYHRLGNL